MTSRRDKTKENRSQLYRQNEEFEMEEQRKEEVRKLLLWKSELMTDVGKLVFAGAVIGGIFEDMSHPWLILGGGTSAVAALFYFGYWFYKKSIRR